MKTKIKVSRSTLGLWIILIVAFVVTGIVDSYFFTIPSLGITLQLAAPLGILAAAQTVVMLTGGIDLSLAMIATGAAYIVSVKSEAGLPNSLLLALAFCIIVGGINAIAIGIFGVNPLIMTLSMSAILIGVFTVGVSTFLRGSSRMPEILITMSSGLILDPITWPLLVWAIVSILVLFTLHRTGFGRLVYAIGDNAHATRLAGVKVWQVQLATYISAAVLAGIAGIMLGGQSGAVAISLANSYLLPSVAAVVIGGTSIMGGIGGYSGTIMGTLILSVLSYLLAVLNSSEALKQLIYGLIVLVLAWIYSSISGQKS